MRGNLRNNVVSGDADAGADETESQPRSTARDAVMNLETETEVGEEDYDPMQQDIDDRLAVFPQGQLEGSSLGGQVTVENVENKNSAEQAL